MHHYSKLLLALVLITPIQVFAKEPAPIAADFMEQRLLRAASDVESICQNASAEVKKKLTSSYKAYKARVNKVANFYRTNFPEHKIQPSGVLRNQNEIMMYEERKTQLKPLSKDVLNRVCTAMALNADLDTDYRINNEFEKWFHEHTYN